MKQFIKEVKKILSLKELRIFPSYLAYNFVLAIIPTITILIFITSVLSISTDSVVNLIRSNIPDNIADIIINIMASKNYSIGVGFLNLTTLYISSKGMYALIETSSSLYGVSERKFAYERLKAITILFFIILSLLFLLLVPILGSKILYLLDNHKLITKEIIFLYKIFKWPLTFLFVFLNIKIIYIIAPSKKIESNSTTLGAFIATTGWAVFTIAFGYYLDYFSKYNVIYGGLSSLVILLIWLYILSYFLILGIVINTRKYNTD